MVVHTIKAGAFKAPTLRPIGGEHPRSRMLGGNRPNRRIKTPIATLVVGAAKMKAQRLNWAWVLKNSKPSA